MHSREDHKTSYLSYMLRMWGKRDGNGKQVWCASLEEPGSHRTESFEDPTAMFAFLQSKLRDGDQGREQPGEDVKTGQGNTRQ